MTRISFHQKLDRLRERLLEMAGLAEQGVQFAIDAQSGAERATLLRVRRNEVAINLADREIDEMAMDLLAMEQPMARDLRFILVAIKINSDLERIGDQSMAIALLSEELAQHQGFTLPVDIPRMGGFQSPCCAPRSKR